MKKSVGQVLVMIRRALVGLVVTGLLVLQIPYVQDKLFARLLLYLSHTTQFAITHEQFQIRWLCYAEVTGLQIRDPDKQELLSAGQITLQISPLRLLIHPQTALQQIAVEEASLQLRKDKAGVLNLALLGKRLTSPPGKVHNKHAHQKALYWRVPRAMFNDCQLIIHSVPAALQQCSGHGYPLHLHELAASLDQLQLQGNTLQVRVKHLSGRHAHIPLALEQLSGTISITPKAVNLQSLILQTARSGVEGNIHVTYNKPPRGEWWADHLQLEMSLQKATLASKELGYLIPYFQQHETQYLLSGQVTGPVSDLQFAGCKLVFGAHRSSLQGQMRLCGLPRLADIRFNATLEQGILRAADLRPHISETLHQTITKLDRIQLQGSFEGTTQNMQVAATFDTDLGGLIADVELSGQEDFSNIAYRGAITTTDFDLGTLWSYPALQRISMQGHIDGQGVTLDTARFQLEGHINKLEYQQHTYEHIYTHGQFARRFFQGKLTIEDPLLNLQAEASIDLNSAPEIISVQGHLKEASLKALQLTPYPATLGTRFSIALKGLSPDQLQADLQLDQLLLKRPTQVLYLKHLKAQVDNTLGHSTLALDSDWVKVQAAGNVTCTQLARDLQRFIQSYRERLLHMPPTSHKAQVAPYACTYQLHCKDINPLLHTIAPEAYVAPDTVVEGSFVQDQGAVLQLHIPTASVLKWGQYQWRETSLKLVAQQTQNPHTLSATAQLTSQQQQWPLLEETQDLALQANWHNDQIHFSQSIAHHAQAYHVRLEGLAKLLAHTTEITLGPSEIVSYKNEWRITPQNRITVGPSWIKFQDWVLSQGPQQVSLTGTLSADPNQILHLRIKDFLLSNLNVALKKSLSGVANASVQLQGTLLQPWIESTIDIHQCVLDDLQIGDIHTATHWQADIAQLQLAATIHHQQAPSLTLTGYYAPLKQHDSLQLDVQLAQAELAMVAPLAAGLCSRLSGKVAGALHVTGTPQVPKCHGQVSITHGGACIDAIGAYYELNSQITCVGQQLTIDHLELIDDQQGKALLQGNIQLQSTRAMLLDIRGQLSRLKVLQLAAGRGRALYGTGVVSGTLSLTGPVDNLSLHLQAKTNAGSNIYIPVGSTENEMMQEGFIHLITNESQREVAKHISQAVRVQGFKLTLALDITPDMMATIILNTTSGDAIQGTGTGNLTLTVDPNGMLGMVGSVEFLQGTYTLSLYQFLKKRFSITPGSRITWQGDIYSGILSVQGTYTQQASIVPLLQSGANREEDLDTRRYPVEVVLDATGVLSTPTLLFDIRFVETMNNAAVDVFRERIKKDPQYLMNQVISLIFFKKFFNDNLVTSSQGSVGRSVSELLSQELSGLASSFSDNLDIDADVDLEALKQQGVNSLRLKLSYSLFGGRLRISRTTSGSSGTKPLTDAERIIGDVTVEYLLTKDGRFRVKVYNKQVDNIASKSTQKQISGGVSFLYTRSFNQWRELFLKRKSD